MCALYLYKNKARSSRYIAAKLGVDQKTIINLIGDSTIIEQQSKEDLAELFAGFVANKQINWFGED